VWIFSRKYPSGHVPILANYAGSRSQSTNQSGPVAMRLADTCGVGSYRK
jgi:hypothetical protein